MLIVICYKPHASSRSTPPKPLKCGNVAKWHFIPITRNLIGVTWLLMIPLQPLQGGLHDAAHAEAEGGGGSRERSAEMEGDATHE